MHLLACRESDLLSSRGDLLFMFSIFSRPRSWQGLWHLYLKRYHPQGCNRLIQACTKFGIQICQVAKQAGNAIQILLVSLVKDKGFAVLGLCVSVRVAQNSAVTEGLLRTSETGISIRCAVASYVHDD